MKIFNWLFDGKTSEEAFEPKEAEPIKAEPNSKKRGYFAEGKEAIAAGVEAEKRFKAEAIEALKEYKPSGPMFKIVQEPAGHFVIQRRDVRCAYEDTRSFYILGGPDKYVRWADKTDALPRTPYEVYETVKNTDAPIKTMDRGYGRTASYERLVGYADLAFNVFADAEAYLFRMVEPAAVTTEYDFPPLKKRMAKKAATK